MKNITFKGDMNFDKQKEELNAHDLFSLKIKWELILIRYLY